MMARGIVRDRLHHATGQRGRDGLQAPGGSTARASRLAWGLFVLSLLLVAVPVAFAASGHDSGSDLFLALPFFVLAYSGVGALIAGRHPANAIGWLFICIGLVAGLEPSAIAYVTHPSLLPGREWAAWLAEWVIVFGFGLIPFVLLLFPDGRLMSRRWRAAAWLSAAAIFLLSFGLAFTPRQVHDEPPAPIENPLGLEILRGNLYFSDEGVGWLLFPAALIAGTASYVLRFRRSRGQVRVQLKWFALAGGFTAIAWILLMFTWQTRLAGLGAVVLGIAMLTLPVAAGIAILQHRLYDIDLIINRTLVYGALTAVLALAYLAGVTVFQALLSPITGESQVAVAGSTLAVAALFGPARSRIQNLIDQRFYRTKYDAGKTLESFSARLRDEIDLDALTKELLGVVTDTMQPAHASLWLRTADELDSASHPRPSG